MRYLFHFSLTLWILAAQSRSKWSQSWEQYAVRNLSSFCSYSHFDFLPQQGWGKPCVVAWVIFSSLIRKHISVDLGPHVFLRWVHGLARLKPSTISDTAQLGQYHGQLGPWPWCHQPPLPMTSGSGRDDDDDIDGKNKSYCTLSIIPDQ